MRVLAITAMYPTPQNPAFGAFVQAQVEALRRAGIDIDVLVMNGRIRKLIYPKGMVQLRRRLAHRHFDLVHAHYSYAGIIARTQWQVPVVVSYCGDDLLGGIGADGRPTALGQVAVRAGQTLSQWVDAVIVKSEEMARLLPRHDVHVIPNEVHFDLFRPMPQAAARRQLSLDPDKRYLLFAANPAETRKRFALAKAVADGLRTADPTIELIPVWRESQQSLALYMNACDVLVFPSYHEGSPNVVKQAMACNLPIVSTDVGDVAAVIGRTRNCHIAEPTTEDFSRRVRLVLQAGERTTGREDIRWLLPAVITRRIIGVYEQTLRRVAGRRCAA